MLPSIFFVFKIPLNADNDIADNDIADNDIADNDIVTPGSSVIVVLVPSAFQKYST